MLEGPKNREIAHPCEVTGLGHATRGSMHKVYQILSQPPYHAAPTVPVAPIPQATNDAVVQPMYYSHQLPIGTPRRAPNTPPLSPRSLPQDKPAYNFPAPPVGHPRPGLPTPPPSPVFAAEQGLPFPAQPLPPPAYQSAPAQPAPLKPAIRSPSQPATVAHPNASVQRHVTWEDQQPRAYRANSEPQFQPHILQAPGPVGQNPHPAHGLHIPQIAQQQFYQQFPQHHIPQHQTMPRHASYSATPVYAHTMPEATVPTPRPSMRPYSYYTGFAHGQYQAGVFREQVQMITQLTDAKQDLANSPSLKTLAQLTPYELEALKCEFEAATGKTLHNFCMNLVAKQKKEVKTLVAGLTLGPIEFDMYLLKVSPVL